MESLLNGTDGHYVFYQSPDYYKGDYPDTTETLDAIRYTIRNGKLEGAWQVKDRKGRVLEQGNYKNSQKTGVWEIVS